MMPGTELSMALRAHAALLDYPGAELQRNADELSRWLPPGAPAALLAHVRDTDLLELQAEYVDTFDRGRATALNLFEHVHGDARERGQAMVDLLEQYRRAGLELGSRELPDYLPAYLQYCSVLGDDAARAALGEIAHLLAHITDALGRRGSPWQAAVESLCALAGEPDWRALLAARQPAGAQAAAGQAPDWTPAALDAAWAEQQVQFVGACYPGAGAAAEQPLRFVARPASAPRAGV